MGMLRIERAEQTQADEVAALALQLWPDHAEADMTQEMSALLASPEAAVFLCRAQGEAVAFAQCQLRHDYVEGCEHSPVGYLEGVYVAEGYRRRGVAQMLLTACEGWARERGCSEFASDCELDNADSLRFHLGAGFEEANRVICFVKTL